MDSTGCLATTIIITILLILFVIALIGGVNNLFDSFAELFCRNC